MKSLMVLWKQLADELAGWCHTSTTLDYKKLERRVEHEGDEFLTITLPRFAKGLERSLELGKVESNHFQGFAFSGGLPRFLGGFLSQVFDRGTGVLLDDPSVDCIFAVRQLTMVFGKILLPCSDARVRGAMRQYVDVEHEVRRSDEVLAPELREEFERVSGLLFADVLSDLDQAVWEGSLLGKHGPGSTADRLLGNQKYKQVEWPLRLEDAFPYLDNVLPSASYWREVNRVDFIEPDAEHPVRVISVPKTLKTPRIIAIEPTCMQFMQQAISERLVQNLERLSVGENTRANVVQGFVGFTRQDPNRQMACEGSSQGNLATLDMSEASDRVSNQHVVSLLRRWPWLSQAVQATRSTKADVPGEGVIPLAKFASMGSALCFPIEAMVFLTVVMMGVQEAHNTRLTRKGLLALRGQVRVYGDDIIVPVDCVDAVIRHLEAFGLKVNKDKSFWNGKFRESCGGDYYDGEWVTPIRFRRVFPTSLQDAEEVISLVSFRNQLYLAGMWQTAGWLDRQLEKLLLGHYPAVQPESPVLGRVSVLCDGRFTTNRRGERLHRSLQVPVVKGWVVNSKLPQNSVDDFWALMKWFLKRGESPFEDVNHLQRSGRPRAVGIKLAWRTPF